MTVALDASMLILLFDEKAAAPIETATGSPVTHCKERIRHFLNRYSRPRGARIVIPTPALAEFLVRTKPEKVPEFLSELQRIRGVQIVPFTIRAAIEFSDMQRVVLTARGKRATTETETRAKAKFDQQIVAIAKAEGASTIYSDDLGLASYANRFGLTVIGIADLPYRRTRHRPTCRLRRPSQAQREAGPPLDSRCGPGDRDVGSRLRALRIGPWNRQKPLAGSKPDPAFVSPGSGHRRSMRTMPAMPVRSVRPRLIAHRGR